MPPAPLHVSVRGATAANGAAPLLAMPPPLTMSRQRSQSHNQLFSPKQPEQQHHTRSKLSPLKLETMTPALVRGSGHPTHELNLPPHVMTAPFPRVSTGVTSSAQLSAPETPTRTGTTPPRPPLNRTRRGSLILTATMKAMLTPFGVSSPADDSPGTSNGRRLWAPRDRTKSNQDSDDSDDSDEDDDHVDALHLELTSPRDNNQREDSGQPSALPNRKSPPPPYFRLSTFLLEDHDNITTTPPSSSPSSPSPQSAGTSSSLTSPRRNTATTPCKATQIDSIFREIWQTEKSYVAALRGLVKQFFEPLQVFAKRNDIALGAMGALHHSTSTILSIHEELLRQLEPLQKQPLASVTEETATTPTAKRDPFGVGFTGTLARLHELSKAFLSTIEYMKVYAFYCGSYLSAKQELERLQRQYPRLAEFTAQLNECALRGSQSDDEGGCDPQQPVVPPLDINSTLIKPVQRICRYPLLFKSLLSNATGPEETLVLQQSLQKIEAVSTYVNEKVRESQNNARLYQLHQMLHPSSHLELLQPSRTLLYEAWGNVTSLDAPRWPAKLLKHFRRRRSGRYKRRRSSLQALQAQQNPRDDWLRMSLFGDDRRTSATVTARSVKSQISAGSGGTGDGSNRHTSFSNVSQANAPLAARLQRRRSSGGERARLILLSDMLLMAKLRDQQLKIRRQICLSCAVIHDEDDNIAAAAAAAAQAPASDGGPGEDGTSEEQELLPPYSAAAAAAVSALEDAQKSESFTLEVSKVGRCACHQFTPLTLRRSPRLSSLSTFLTGRRSSISFASSSAIAGDIFQSMQRHDSHAGATSPDTLSRAPSLSSRLFTSRTSKSGSRFRYLEQLAGIRSVKRYRVTCDSVQEKTKFLKALRDAMARSARLVSLGSGGTSASGIHEQSVITGAARATSCASSASSASSTRAKAVALAVNLPARIWRSIRSASEATGCGGGRLSGGVATTTQATNCNAIITHPSPPRRRRSSLASVHNIRAASEADLLQLDADNEGPADAGKTTQGTPVLDCSLLL